VPAGPPPATTRSSEAKAGKNFAESDRLRKEIESLGWIVKDGKDGATVVKK